MNVCTCRFIGLCSYRKATGSNRAVLQITLEVPLKTQASWTGGRLGLAGCVKHCLTLFTPEWETEWVSVWRERAGWTDHRVNTSQCIEVIRDQGPTWQWCRTGRGRWCHWHDRSGRCSPSECKGHIVQRGWRQTGSTYSSRPHMFPPLSKHTWKKIQFKLINYIYLVSGGVVLQVKNVYYLIERVKWLTGK